MAHLRGRERARYVTRMFGRISRRYDLLNTVMSGGRHHSWRRMACEMATDDLSGPALDVATGTGDFAFSLLQTPGVSDVVGIDFTPKMLAVAVDKAGRRGLGRRTRFVRGDAHALPFPSDQFACATVGFGIRNFVDARRALEEIARTVRPKGRVAVLEIVRAERRVPVGRLFSAGFRYITPWLGAVLAGDREAYGYLPESVEGFLDAEGLKSMMEEAELTNIRWKRLALGTVAILVGEKR